MVWKRKFTTKKLPDQYTTISTIRGLCCHHKYLISSLRTRYLSHLHFILFIHYICPAPIIHCVCVFGALHLRKKHYICVFGALHLCGEHYICVSSITFVFGALHLCLEHYICVWSITWVECVPNSPSGMDTKQTHSIRCNFPCIYHHISMIYHHISITMSL